MSIDEYNFTQAPDDTTYDDEWPQSWYRILRDGTGNGTFAPDGSQATITYIVEYDAFPIWLDVLLGKTVKGDDALVRSGASGNYNDFSGSLPEEHPYCSNFYAQTAEVKPMGRLDGGDKWIWGKAAITVCFRPVDYNLIGDDEDFASELDRFTSKTNEGFAEFQTVNGKQFKFVATQKVLDLQPAFVVAAQKMSYVWRRIPCALRDDGYPDLGKAPNWETVLPLLGRINSVDFDGYNPGTVLFQSFGTKLILPSAATSDNYYMDITYNFGVRDYGTSVYAGGNVGWNYAWNPDNGKWDLFTDSGAAGGNRLYKADDLNALFEVAW